MDAQILILLCAKCYVILYASDEGLLGAALGGGSPERGGGGEGRGRRKCRKRKKGTGMTGLYGEEGELPLPLGWKA